eukprot:6193913-Pleurochrysis_carterae.AAC.2
MNKESSHVHVLQKFCCLSLCSQYANVPSICWTDSSVKAAQTLQELLWHRTAPLRVCQANKGPRIKAHPCHVYSQMCDALPAATSEMHLRCSVQSCCMLKEDWLQFMQEWTQQISNRLVISPRAITGTCAVFRACRMASQRIPRSFQVLQQAEHYTFGFTRPLFATAGRHATAMPARPSAGDAAAIAEIRECVARKRENCLQSTERSAQKPTPPGGGNSDKL